MVNKTVFLVVIDDEAIVLETLKLLLQRSGFEVLAALSAEDAVADLAACGKDPDVIIADHRLANYKAGTDAIRLVRNFAGKSIPGIIITGDTSSRLIQDIQASGIRIMHKPVQAETLKNVINDICERGS